MHQLLAIALDELKRESYVKEKRMKEHEKQKGDGKIQNRINECFENYR